MGIATKFCNALQGQMTMTHHYDSQTKTKEISMYATRICELWLTVLTSCNFWSLSFCNLEISSSAKKEKQNQFIHLYN